MAGEDFKLLSPLSLSHRLQVVYRTLVGPSLNGLFEKTSTTSTQSREVIKVFTSISVSRKRLWLREINETVNIPISYTLIVKHSALFPKTIILASRTLSSLQFEVKHYLFGVFDSILSVTIVVSL